MPTLQKAHRRVRVKASDWGAQACKTSSKSPIVWVNNVGTFWSGVSSFLVEQAHGFTGPTRIKYPTGISFSPLWTIFTSLLEDETDGSLFGSSLSPWRWLEHPSHRKFRGGFALDCVGYWMTLLEFVVQLEPYVFNIQF